MMVVYAQVPLQLAYADDEERFHRILGFSSTAEICQFVRERHIRGEELYFICDQMNALDHFPNNGNTLVPRL
jgi:hypothetical protein